MERLNAVEEKYREAREQIDKMKAKGVPAAGAGGSQSQNDKGKTENQPRQGPRSMGSKWEEDAETPRS